MILGIFGAGGLGREVLIVAKKINTLKSCWEKIIFVVDNPVTDRVVGVPVVSFVQAQELKNNLEISVAIGEPSSREIVYNRLKENNFKFATLIHPGVYIDETTTIGNGVTICEGATITSCVTIGDNVYIQPHAEIGHDIKIRDHSVIGSNAEIGGTNIIGKRVFIGFMVGTLQGLTIGDDVEISAGSIVFRDIESAMIVMGNPARVIRRNEGHGVFHKTKN